MRPLIYTLSALLFVLGAVSAWYMETAGHVVTGMDNFIVWGMPHVFAIFMVVAASGVVNIASIASVFAVKDYKPYAPLSGIMSLALLAGGLFVLMLDLGRADRIMVAATNYNLTSVFAWNVLLYSGMFFLVACYVWVSLERRMHDKVRLLGIGVFVWRIILTTGTGSIFAFLVARQAYHSAILPPLFIALSLTWGLALFVLVQSLLAPTDFERIRARVGRLLAIFSLVSLYLVAVYHFTNAYFAQQQAFTRFILVDGGVYALLFWTMYVVVGSLLPMALLWLGTPSLSRLVTAALLIVLGALGYLYVFIIGGQAFPLELFPGYTVTPSLTDARIYDYTPSLPEISLGIGGVALALLATLILTRILPILPRMPNAALVPKEVL